MFEDYNLRKCEVCKKLTMHQRVHKAGVVLYICVVCAVRRILELMEVPDAKPAVQDPLAETDPSAAETQEVGREVILV